MPAQPTRTFGVAAFSQLVSQSLASPLTGKIDVQNPWESMQQSRRCNMKKIYNLCAEAKT
ncbi:hypothetical protein V2J09_011406 [Rumex salicifolius]